MLNRFRSAGLIFVMVVLLPTLLATAYFGFLAEDVYVSESRILVRSPSKPDVSPLGSVLGAGALTGASEERNAVREFLRSRDALQQVNGDGLVRQAYGRPSIFWLDRFGGIGGDSFEELYEYFNDKMAIDDGETTLVLRLTVEAFTPIEARVLNERLLRRSESLVNELSDRAREDAISLAEDEVAEARDQSRSASLALSRFRDQARVIDPELQARVGLQTIAQLQEQLIGARTRLLQVETYTPEASQIPFLRAQVRELEREISRQTDAIAGGAGSLSANAGRFQELQLASEFAEQQLTVALTSLQDAQAQARRKQAYVDRVAQPSLPDHPTGPKRIRNIVATLLLGLLAWGVLSMLIVGIREHRD